MVPDGLPLKCDSNLRKGSRLWGVVLYSVEQIKYQDAYDYYLGKKQKEAVTPASGMTMFPIIIVPDFAGCFPLIKNEYGVT